MTRRTVDGPAPRPCRNCPYRVDVPSGIWAPSEYAKLTGYDAETAMQPTAVFLCHLQGAGDRARMCAGWVGCHGGDELLAVRIAAAAGDITRDTAAAAYDYVSPVELFRSGAAAARHGLAEIDAPGPAATAAAAKLLRVDGIRRDV